MRHQTTDCEIIHADVFDKVKKEMPQKALADKLSAFFKIMGDGTRVRILWALDKNEMCVCDLAVLLNMTKSAISHQLKLLRDTKLVRFRKEGKNVFYSLDDEHIQDIFEKAVEHVTEEK
ncbi:ArsR/SmtB family transcription factor [Inediibacterium massiliense]|uniref:ArsR/SmtB family transcription factor n=1 Tax=Inediibacterium massiliense TaxID=1658111 RepID=UPI0006B41A4C|nr:metalloregulator ArsR/SmtB family transcription factor [Inediibacterium massiliense]